MKCLEKENLIKRIKYILKKKKKKKMIKKQYQNTVLEILIIYGNILSINKIKL